MEKWGFVDLSGIKKIQQYSIVQFSFQNYIFNLKFFYVKTKWIVSCVDFDSLKISKAFLKAECVVKLKKN